VSAKVRHPEAPRGEAMRQVDAFKAFKREQARAAIRRIRERAEKLKLGPFEWAEWKFYRDGGRSG
jgi:hypothetical protein